jgi:hypothetical protein
VCISILPENKKAVCSTNGKISFPQENIWLALRESKEKAALAGDKFQKSLLLARFYARARTYFSANT